MEQFFSIPTVDSVFADKLYQRTNHRICTFLPTGNQSFPGADFRKRSSASFGAGRGDFRSRGFFFFGKRKANKHLPLPALLWLIYTTNFQNHPDTQRQHRSMGRLTFHRSFPFFLSHFCFDGICFTCAHVFQRSVFTKGTTNLFFNALPLFCAEQRQSTEIRRYNLSLR